MTESKRQKEELVRRYNLTEEMLQQKVTDEHMLDIQEFIKSWREVGPFLSGIEQQNLDDIDRENGDDEREKRRKFIHKWEDANGPDATYDNMIFAMVRAMKKDEATKVCQLLRPGQ